MELIDYQNQTRFKLINGTSLRESKLIKMLTSASLLSGSRIISAEHLNIYGAPLPDYTQFYEVALENGLKVTIGLKHVGKSAHLRSEINLANYCERRHLKHYPYQGNFSGGEYGWFLITEYIPGVTILSECKLETKEDLDRIVTQGMQNLIFMHSKGIFHGNASLQNLGTLTNRNGVVEPFLFNFSNSKLFSDSRTPEKFQIRDRDAFAQSIKDLASLKGFDASDVDKLIGEYPMLSA